ncbi:hypothetical protein [Streptomyces silvisoli]|uniref:Uncharacterized protein n=1 Tax=Streptomyces silvisoli TaxID=3034235 RepID=A0ABT5ZRB3_9ACTN|nr:hypothetical protein [Streptomyces silvisoli]MDF3292353.1 hypothetical protein [Streptomyces silvisoli]
MADADCLVSNDSGPWSPELVLSGLLTHEFVKLYRYADDGPAADLPRKKYGPFTKAVPGWVELLAADAGAHVRQLTYADSESAGRGGIIGNRAQIAQADVAAKSYQELGEATACVRREADSLAAQAAETVHADLFITERPYLRESKIPYGVTVCTPQEALALIGLYLRMQGLYITYRGPDGRGTYSMNKGLYYWVGTRELLPAAWRWFAACVQHSIGVGDQTLINLGGSLLRRLQTALQNRDELHRSLNLEQNNDTALEILDRLDVILVSLMGAIDVAARVAHHALDLQSGIYAAAWQKKNWLKEVQAKNPGLAAAVGPNTPGRHTVTILRLLRNSVHGEALSSLAVRNMSGPIETRVHLPQADSTEILAAMDALGGRADWGVKEIIRGRWDADPGMLVEHLVPHIVDLLNDLMKRTPVEQLSHVSVTPKDELPPTDPQGPFNPRERESIRWQFGF